MPSFFEKLKKGMDVEVDLEEKEKIDSEAETIKPAKKQRVKAKKKEPKNKEAKEEREEKSEEKKEEALEKEKPEAKEEKKVKKDLNIDVVQKEDELIIRAPLEETDPEEIDISVEDGILMIKRTGDSPISREIILPPDAESSKARAEMKDGVLMISVPKKKVKEKKETVVAAKKVKEPAKEREKPPKKELTRQEPEGELAIDVFQKENELIVQSAIAGVKAEELDIRVDDNILIIRGVREKTLAEEGKYLTEECFWGPFAREFMLPVNVDPNNIKAELKGGVLTIRMAIISKEEKRVLIEEFEED